MSAQGRTNDAHSTALGRDLQPELQQCGYHGEHRPHGVGIYHCDGIPLPPLPDSAYPTDAQELT